MNETIKLCKVGRHVFKLWGTPEIGYSISDKGGWIVGVFDSEDSAKMGYRLTLEPWGWSRLARLAARVNYPENGDRPITVADLEGCSLMSEEV